MSSSNAEKGEESLTPKKPLSFTFKTKSSHLNIKSKSEIVTSTGKSISFFEAGESFLEKGENHNSSLIYKAPIPLVADDKWFNKGKITSRARAASTQTNNLASGSEEIVSAVISDWTDSVTLSKKNLSGEKSIPLLSSDRSSVDVGRPLSDIEKFKNDVNFRPNECTTEQYEAMPVEHFGVLLVKGMLKENERLEEELKEPRKPLVRYGRRGLGASMSIEDQDIENLLRKNKKGKGYTKQKIKASTKILYKKNAQSVARQADLCEGDFVEVTAGKLMGSCGRISSINRQHNYSLLELPVENLKVKLLNTDLKIIPEKKFLKAIKSLAKT